MSVGAVKFENIINSEYYRSKASLKTVAFIAGEGEGDARKTSTITCADGAGYGLSRRELYIDARDISQTVDEVTLTESEYKAKLDQRGFEKLNHKDNILQSAFDGRVETTHLYVYGEDFFMGDVVQIANEYDMETEARVVELIRSHSITGVDIYPTFSTTN